VHAAIPIRTSPWWSSETYNDPDLFQRFTIIAMCVEAVLGALLAWFTTSNAGRAGCKAAR
jgi:hypothetical protein